jgi:hypothetical protein
MFSITTIVSAGHITPADNLWVSLQELSLDQAKSLANVLAVATNGSVCVKWIGVGSAKDIVVHPGDIEWNVLS